MNLLVDGTADFMIREGLIWALSELSKLKGYPGVVRAAAVAFAVIVANPSSRERLIQEKVILKNSKHPKDQLHQLYVHQNKSQQRKKEEQLF